MRSPLQDCEVAVAAVSNNNVNRTASIFAFKFVSLAGSNNFKHLDKYAPYARSSSGRLYFKNKCLHPQRVLLLIKGFIGSSV